MGSKYWRFFSGDSLRIYFQNIFGMFSRRKTSIYFFLLYQFNSSQKIRFWSSGIRFILLLFWLTCSRNLCSNVNQFLVSASLKNCTIDEAFNAKDSFYLYPFRAIILNLRFMINSFRIPFVSMYNNVYFLENWILISRLKCVMTLEIMLYGAPIIVI